MLILDDKQTPMRKWNFHRAVSSTNIALGIGAAAKFHDVCSQKIILICISNLLS